MADTMYSGDTKTINDIVKAYYEVVSGAAGKPREVARDKYIHHNDAIMVFPYREPKNGQNFALWSIKEFHESIEQTAHNEVGFYENEIARQVFRFGRSATVISVYESRRRPDGPVFSRGVNFLQLFLDSDTDGSDRWYITSSSFERESENNPIPAEWLKSI